MIRGLQTVIYKVDDLDAAKEFYSTLLGFGPYFDEPFYVGFNVRGFELGLDPDNAGTTQGNNQTGYWNVEDIETAFEAISKIGAPVVQQITAVGGDIRVAAFKDPAGNVFGIIEDPNYRNGVENGK